jgi:hypothetical protein
MNRSLQVQSAFRVQPSGCLFPIEVNTASGSDRVAASKLDWFWELRQNVNERRRCDQFRFLSASLCG